MNQARAVCNRRLTFGSRPGLAGGGGRRALCIKVANTQFAPSPALEPLASVEDCLADEEAVRQSERRYRELVERLPAALYTCDSAGRVTMFNEAAAALWGRRPLIGQDRWCGSYRLYRPDGSELPLDECPMAVTLREGRAVVGEEIVIERPDGVRRAVLPHPEPIFSPSGEMAGAVNMLVDITDIKDSEDALRRADRRKDEFLATLAHELRNPLAPIRNALHLLRLSANQPGDEGVHAMMSRQVDHLVRLVDDLMEVSRITRGKIDLRRERVDLTVILQVAVETSQPLLDAAHHHFVVSLPSESLTLDADAVRLVQVFANLLSNAAKYTPEGGHVWLTAFRQGSDAVISVKDTGIGISREMLPGVFDLFVQGEHGQRDRGGLGIGLTLVKRLVDMHGGSVEARSGGDGRGSEFRVSLPLAAAPTASSTPSHAPAERPVRSLADRRVLVVDDNRDGADSLGMMLQALGAETHVVYDGRSALAQIATIRPDIVLLDIGMPDMSGHDVAREIRRLPELGGVLLIALTGWGQDEDRRRSADAGIDYHLVKPLEFETLQTVLTSLEALRGERAKLR